MDGPQVDDGTAWEIGYFYQRGLLEQKIIGIRTDFRRAGECEGAAVNLGELVVYMASFDYLKARSTAFQPLFQPTLSHLRAFLFPPAPEPHTLE